MSPFPSDSPETDKAEYIVVLEDGSEHEVVPAELCRRFERDSGHLQQIEAWNEAGSFFDDLTDSGWKNHDKAMALLHNRHSKSDLARLICDLLNGKTPKILK